MAAESGDEASLLSSVDVPVEVEVPWDLLSWEVGTRCCTMVLLTANLKAGAEALSGVDSEITALRMLFCSSGRRQVRRVQLRRSLDDRASAHDDCAIPLGRLCVIVEFRAAKGTRAGLKHFLLVPMRCSSVTLLVARR